MNAKARKQLIALLLAAAVLGCVCLGLWLLNRSQAAASDGEASSGLSLDLPQSLTALAWGNGSVSFSFRLEDGAWQWAEDPDFPLLSSRIETIANCLSTLTASRTLDVPDDLSAYGLDSPVTLTLTGADGGEQTLLLGGNVGENYYLMKQGGDRVYVIGNTLPSYLSVSLYDLADTDLLPSVTQDSVDSVTVTGAQQSVLTVAAAGDGSYTWTCNGADITDSALLSALREEFENIDFYQLGGFKESEDLLAQCGLTDPVSVTVLYRDADGAEAQFTLLVGDPTEDGNYYYASPDGGVSIFYLARDRVDSLMALAGGGFDAAAAALNAAS